MIYIELTQVITICIDMNLTEILLDQKYKHSYVNSGLYLQ